MEDLTLGKWLNRITYLVTVGMFLFVISSMYQVYTLYNTRGSTWETITIYDDVSESTEEHIEIYLVGIVLSIFVLLILIHQYRVIDCTDNICDSQHGRILQ